MSISYDVFVSDFLDKLTEYELLGLFKTDREDRVYGFLRRAMYRFDRVCSYDIVLSKNDDTKEYEVEIPDEEIDEISDIVSEGMIVQWLKPYVNSQDLLENSLNTSDFTKYSSSTLLNQVRTAYESAEKNFKQMLLDYSYNYGDLTDLSL